MDIIVGGIALGPIITFIVQLAKRFGLPDGYAGYAAAVLSVLGFVLLQVTNLFPATLDPVVNILRIILAISGVFGSALVSYLGLRKSEVFKT